MRDLKDKEFDRWTVLYRGENVGYRKVWICKCKCGTIKPVLEQNLIGNKSHSCGCWSDEYCWKGVGELSSTYWSRLKADAFRRNLSFEIDIEFGWILFLKQNRKCALTGLDIEFAKDSKALARGDITASLDRIDSKKNYTKDNVQWVHKTVNKIKQNLSDEELIYWANLLVQYNKE